MASEGRSPVATPVAAARRDLEEAKASLARGDDCAVALAILARAATRRDEAMFALLDARGTRVTASTNTKGGYSTLPWQAKEIPMSDTLIYTVPDMHCGHCERAVSEEASAVAGVESVTVDLDSKRVTVIGTGLDDAKLRAAIEEAGYEAA